MDILVVSSYHTGSSNNEPDERKLDLLLLLYGLYHRNSL